MSFTNYFVYGKTHAIRTWSLVNILVQFGQLGLLILVNVRQTGNTDYYFLFPVFALLSVVLFWWDAKRDGIFEREIDYTVNKTAAWREVMERLERIENKLGEPKK